MRWAMTGGGGFVGGALMRRAAGIGMEVVGLGHQELSGADVAIKMTGCHAVIHCAARAHVLKETASDPLAVFRSANRDLTLALARAAMAAGIRRFVFVSSIGVLGTNSPPGAPWSSASMGTPVEPYGIAKREAEEGLIALAREGRMELVIIRPPLVHGPGAKGNFHKLMAAIAAGRPLPLGAVHNRRSFVGLDNLCEALMTAATMPWDSPEGPPLLMKMGGRDGVKGEPTTARIYHVADDGVISTTRLVKVLAEGMDLAPRMIPLPRWLAMAGATMLGKRSLVRRLFDDLEVDDAAFRYESGWRPRTSLEDGLRLMADDFIRRHRMEGVP